MALLRGSGGDRRRRVLTEQVISEPSAEDPAAGTVAGPAYAEGVLAAQPRLTDFVARRYTTITLLVLLAALGVVALEALHTYLPELARVVRPQHLAAFDLAAPGSLAAWFAALLWGCAAVGCVMIYAVRRHRVDDYHGRYGVWRWAALSAGLLSINAVADLHPVGADVAAWLSGVAGWHDGAAWWLGGIGVMMAVVGVRLLLEVRRCRLALVALLAAMAAWGSGIAAGLGLLEWEAVRSTPMLATAGSLGGSVLLLAALLLYARHVVLDAGGEIAVRQPKPKRQPKKKPREKPAGPVDKDQAEATRRTRKAKTSKRVKVEAAHEAPPETRSKRRTRKEQPVEQDEWVDGSQEDDWTDGEPDRGATAKRRKLSKSERKRLRKLKQQQRR